MRVDEPEPGRVLTESDTGSSLVTTWTVTPEGHGSRVRVETRWQGAGGVGGVFERLFAPRVLRGIYSDELGRLDRYAAPPRRSEPRATSPARRSALGVELAGEVFEAAVDLEGDDPMAGAKAAGDLRRRDEVGAGRRAGEDPLGAGGLARHRERGRFGDGDDLVEVLGGEHRRPAPDAAALDMVDARDPAGQHRRLRWLHDRSMQTRQRDQRAAGAEETASGPDVAAERVDGRWTG